MELDKENSKKGMWRSETAIVAGRNALAEAESIWEKSKTMNSENLKSLEDMLTLSALKKLEKGCSSVVMNLALKGEEEENEKKNK